MSHTGREAEDCGVYRGGGVYITDEVIPCAGAKCQHAADNVCLE